MRRRFLQIVCFVIASVIQVRVKAQLYEPHRCWETTSFCAVEASENHTVLGLIFGEVGLSRGAIVLRQEDGQVHIVRGLVGFRLNGLGRISTPFAQVSGNGEGLLERAESEIYVSALRGELKISPRGSNETLNLPQGFRLKVAAVGEQGRSLVDVPQALVPTVTLRKWWRVTGSSKKEFLSSSKELLDKWQQSVEIASQMQQDLAHRHIASVKAERERAEEKKKLEEIERKKLRSLFRRLNHLED